MDPKRRLYVDAMGIFSFLQTTL